MVKRTTTEAAPSWGRGGTADGVTAVHSVFRRDQTSVWDDKFGLRPNRYAEHEVTLNHFDFRLTKM